MDPSAYLKDVPTSVLILIIFVLLFFLNDWWKNFRQKNEDESKAINQLSLAIVELRVEIKNLKEILQDIPKIRRDIDAAHDKIREISN